MIRLQVLGIRCPNCDQLYRNAEQAAREAGVPCRVEKVADILRILDFSPLALPALAVNGRVRAEGRVLSPDAIRKLLVSPDP